MSLTFEHCYPWGLGLFAWCVGAIVGFSPDMAPEAFFALISAAISVSGTLAGLLVATQSIVMSLPLTIERLRTSGYHQEMANYLSSAVFISVVFCLANILGFFSWATTHAELFFSVWTGLGVAMTAAFWRVMRIMKLLFLWEAQGQP